MNLGKEPVAIVGLATSLAVALLPILLLAGVSDTVVTAVGVAVVAISSAALAFLRSVVTPSSQVALTVDDVAALTASPQTPQQAQGDETAPSGTVTPPVLPGGH